MSLNSMDEYWVPEHVKEYLRGLGFVLPLDDMEPWIRSWDEWMGARGDFYDYRDKDGLGRGFLGRPFPNFTFHIFTWIIKRPSQHGR